MIITSFPSPSHAGYDIYTLLIICDFTFMTCLWLSPDFMLEARGITWRPEQNDSLRFLRSTCNNHVWPWAGRWDYFCCWCSPGGRRAELGGPCSGSALPGAVRPQVRCSGTLRWPRARWPRAGLAAGSGTSDRFWIRAPVTLGSGPLRAPAPLRPAPVPGPAPPSRAAASCRESRAPHWPAYHRDTFSRAEISVIFHARFRTSAFENMTCGSRVFFYFLCFCLFLNFIFNF